MMWFSQNVESDDAAISGAKVGELEPRREKSGMNPPRMEPKEMLPLEKRAMTTAKKEKTMRPTMTLMMRSKSFAPPPPAW